MAIYVFCGELKPKARQLQLVHFPVDGEPAKNAAAQQLAREGWKKRRANG